MWTNTSTTKEDCCFTLLLFVSKTSVNPLPKPISWGRDNEARACLAYVDYMQKRGHPVKTAPSGFVVHPDKGWLGASPDAWVTDPSSAQVEGIAEFKCPYTKLGVTPEEACEDSNFCCTMVNGRIQLKREHQYYHQVQLQLFIASDLCHWCDFCIYTTKGVTVERIFPDSLWRQKNCPVLENYFFDFMLSELVYPQHKPSYFPKIIQRLFHLHVCVKTIFENWIVP